MCSPNQDVIKHLSHLFSHPILNNFLNSLLLWYPEFIQKISFIGVDSFSRKAAILLSVSAVLPLLEIQTGKRTKYYSPSYFLLINVFGGGKKI